MMVKPEMPLGSDRQAEELKMSRVSVEMNRMDGIEKESIRRTAQEVWTKAYAYEVKETRR